METKNLSGLTPAWLISLALVLGTTIVVLIPASIAGGDTIKSSDWIGFAGNVVSGAMTLIAAIIAWFAVQRQISAQADMEAKRDREAEERTALTQAGAKQIGAMALSQTIHASTGVLFSIRKYLKSVTLADQKNWMQAVDKSFVQLDNMLNRLSFAEVTMEMNINDKLVYLALISQLKSIVSINQNPAGILPRQQELAVAEGQLDGLHYYLKIFDEDLAYVFKRDSTI